MNLEEYLYNKVVSRIDKWKAKRIYAISFFIDPNMENTFNGKSNVTEFSIGYNTEASCEHAPQLSEKRWNLMWHRKGDLYIIDSRSKKNDEGIKFLFEWYEKKGITNIGHQDTSKDYNADMKYIGKGPVGCGELLHAVTNVAKKLQAEGKIERFGNIPIIIHDLENSWYTEEATQHANPNGEADVFLKALREGFPESVEEDEETKARRSSIAKELFNDPFVQKSYKKLMETFEGDDEKKAKMKAALGIKDEWEDVE